MEPDQSGQQDPVAILISEVMHPASDRYNAELVLIVWIRAARDHAADVPAWDASPLLEAAEDFYQSYGSYAVENDLRRAYRDLSRAWQDMKSDYSSGVRGHGIADSAFALYRVIVDHRIIVD